MPISKERRLLPINSSSKLDSRPPRKQPIQNSPPKRSAVRRPPPSKCPNHLQQSMQHQRRAPEAIITFSTAEKSGSIWPIRSTRCWESVRWRWSGRLSLLRSETMQIIREPQPITRAPRRTRATRITICQWLSKRRKMTWTGMPTSTLFGTMWPSSPKSSAS